MKGLSWLKSRSEFKRIAKEMGLNKEQTLRLKNILPNGDEAVLQTINEIQDEQREFLHTQGIDHSNTTPEIGKEIQWNDVLSMAFRVVDFDRNDTAIDLDGGAETVKAKSKFEPYGYLLVESPTLNQPVGLPIVHSNDFWLAASVFDDPSVLRHINPQERELLVTYQPEKTLPDGRNASIQHCLHFALLPHGSLERYYSSDQRMAEPEPELLFRQFIYSGEISVLVNLQPRL